MRKLPTPGRKDPKGTPNRGRKPGRPSPTKQSKPQQPSSSPRSRKSTVNTTADVSRRTRRFKRGAKALKEIKALQRTTSLLLPKASFCRLVREIINLYSPGDFRIQSSALEALQEAAEMYMVQFFEDSLLCTLHAKRVTLMLSDCHLMRRLRGPSEVANR